MSYSVYHLFCELVNNKNHLLSSKKLEKFPFDKDSISCKSKGQFPDFAIRLNQNDSMYTGGELIELKDSASYSVSSFNSTIPTGEKDISTLIGGKRNTIREQMERAGNNILSLPIRQVFYLYIASQIIAHKRRSIELALDQRENCATTTSTSSLISLKYLL